MHECSNEGWDHVMRINAFGVFLTNREAVRFMLDQPLDVTGLRGTVLNVGSVLDRAPSPAFRDARLRREQGGRPGVDLGRRGAVCVEPDPVQPGGPRFDRHTDGRPSRE